MTRRRETSRGGPGFTLIELLIVMAIVAIGFFALRPSFGGVLRGAKRRAALRKLVGLLTSARTHAVAQGRLVRVMCDPVEGVLWAEVQTDPAVDRSEFELLPTLNRREVRLPENLALVDMTVSGETADAFGQIGIYFYPDGRTDGAELVLADDRGRETRVDLAPTTGRVTVSD